jgi:(p)ppGpp synthase/HD superfamily hydrolase
MLQQAISLAVEAHAQSAPDKGGQPYILHPLRVMLRLETDDERIVAVLHDVVEDTQHTLDSLRARGFSAEVVAALDCVTKREGEAYEQFITRCEKNPLARRVKLADLEDNMDVRRLASVSAKDAERLAKYVTSWHRLKAVDKESAR